MSINTPRKPFLIEVLGAFLAGIVMVSTICCGVLAWKLLWFLCSWTAHFADRILPLP